MQPMPHKERSMPIQQVGGTHVRYHDEPGEYRYFVIKDIADYVGYSNHSQLVKLAGLQDEISKHGRLSMLQLAKLSNLFAVMHEPRRTKALAIVAQLADKI